MKDDETVQYRAAKTDAFVASRRAKRKVEMLFAHIKKIMGLDRLRPRGSNVAEDEFTFTGRLPNRLETLRNVLAATRV